MRPDCSASKAGLLMLMKELAAELGPYGALVPLRRLGEPDDVAKVTEFLLDPDRSGYITGADVAVDGGLDQFNWLHHRYGSAAAEQARVGPGPQGAGQEPDAASR